MLEFIDYFKATNISNVPEILSTCRKSMEALGGDVEDIRRHLLELNLFLYHYYLIKFEKVEKVRRLTHEDQIHKLDSPEALLTYGEEMVLDYLSTGLTTLDGHEDEIIDACLQNINENFMEKLSLEDLASSLHISKNHLCQIFHEKTGFRFCQYLNMQRIKEAQKMIQEDRKTFEYISFACSFGSQCHFSTTFKNYVSMTPKEYRKSLGIKNNSSPRSKRAVIFFD